MTSKRVAIKPDFFAQIAALRERKIAEKKGVTEEELAFHAMSQVSGWKHFKNLTQSLLDEMDMILETSITQGATREQIGENTIINISIKRIIKRLLSAVDDATEAVNEKG
jgi:hypothetical protein